MHERVVSNTVERRQEHNMRLPKLSCSPFFTKKSESKKGHNSCKNGLRVFSIVGTYSPNSSEHNFEFQVYMFSNGRDMTKCQFLHDNTMAIPIS